MARTRAARPASQGVSRGSGLRIWTRVPSISCPLPGRGSRAYQGRQTNRIWTTARA